jgi:hypothetical protein
VQHQPLEGLSSLGDDKQAEGSTAGDECLLHGTASGNQFLVPIDKANRRWRRWTSLLSGPRSPRFTGAFPRARRPAIGRPSPVRVRPTPAVCRRRIRSAKGGRRAVPVVQRARRAIEWPTRWIEWPTITPVRPKRAIRAFRSIPTIAERLPAALRLAAPTR